MPRVVAPGVVECGPYFDRYGSGGYFVVKGIEGRREFHWYAEHARQGDQYLMTRDEAFDTALDAVDTPRAADERRAA
ncbi:hypothetical protein EFP19_09460 [Burkholderia glumae]|nr:hypothetical protein EFP19_09460 [Burkholderia glumae]